MNPAAVATSSSHATPSSTKRHVIALFVGIAIGVLLSNTLVSCNCGDVTSQSHDEEVVATRRAAGGRRRDANRRTTRAATGRRTDGGATPKSRRAAPRHAEAEEEGGDSRRHDASADSVSTPDPELRNADDGVGSETPNPPTTYLKRRANAKAQSWAGAKDGVLRLGDRQALAAAGDNDHDEDGGGGLPKQCATSRKFPYVSPALAIAHVDPDKYWTKAAEAIEDASKAGLFVEIGCFDGMQASAVLSRGMSLIMMEPSPVNYDRTKGLIQGYLSRGSTEKQVIEFHHAAASSRRAMLTFWSVGASGDHINDAETAPPGEDRNYRSDNTKKIRVPAYTLDEVIGKRRIYVLKIDTQGHDYSVMQGAKRIFQEKRVAICIVEYHPLRVGRETAIDMIRFFDQHGYDSFFGANMSMTNPVYQTDWVAAPLRVDKFVDSFSPYPMFGLGQFTDIVAICRTCVPQNMLGGEHNRKVGAPVLVPVVETQVPPSPPPRAERRKKVTPGDDRDDEADTGRVVNGDVGGTKKKKVPAVHRPAKDRDDVAVAAPVESDGGEAPFE